MNDLRTELKASRTKVQDLETAMGISRKHAATTTEALIHAINVEKGKRKILSLFFKFFV